MILYFSPFFKVAYNAIVYKHGALFFASIGITTLTEFLNLEILGKPMHLLILVSFLFIVDFFTGVAASRHEAKIANEIGDVDTEEEKKFKSSKITFTFFKFIMLFAWIWLEESVSDRIAETESISHLYNLIRNIPIILLALREYISIGENIERQYGKKPYMFTLADKIFETLEFKFLKNFKSRNQLTSVNSTKITNDGY